MFHASLPKAKASVSQTERVSTLVHEVSHHFGTIDAASPVWLAVRELGSLIKGIQGFPGTNVCMYVCMYVCIYVYVFVRVCTYICVHIHI